jgi:putative hydrolase
MGINDKKLKIVADMHIHTLASVHAYATISEMVSEAASLGLFAMAITDHAHLAQSQYFGSLVLIPEYFKGVRVLRGVEANVCDYNGNLDVDEELQGSLDWVVASIHAGTIDGTPDLEKCTNAYLQLAKNPNVNVIGHSGSQYFKYDYDRVIPEFAREGKLVEINDSAFRYNKDYKGNCINIARLCQKYNARICVDTDAHFTDTLGRANSALKALEEIDFPEKLIVNANEENLKSYFDENHISY